MSTAAEIIVKHIASGYLLDSKTVPVQVEQRHLDAGIKLGSACPLALAAKEQFDKLPVPAGYLRVERAMQVSSTVWVTEHRIIKRKGREEIDLAFFHYLMSPDTLENSCAFGLNEPLHPYTATLTELFPIPEEKEGKK